MLHFSLINIIIINEKVALLLTLIRIILHPFTFFNLVT